MAAAATSTRRTTRCDGAVARRRRSGGIGGGACSCVRVRVRVPVRSIRRKKGGGDNDAAPARLRARNAYTVCTPHAIRVVISVARIRSPALTLARARNALSVFFPFFFLHVHGLNPRPTAAIKKDAQPIPL